MLNKLSARIIEWLISVHSISEADKELYIYGSFVLLSNIFYIFITIIIGFIFHCVFHLLILYVSLFFLRNYAGGYHANSETKCEIITTFTILLSAILIKYTVQSDNLLLLIISIICALIIVIFAPVTSAAKPLDAAEIKRNKIITLIIVCILGVSIAIAFTFHIKMIYLPCCLSLIIETIALLGGIIKNRLEDRQTA